MPIPTPPPKVYLITGTSSGLGLSLTHAVLASPHNHKLIATSRKPAKTPDAVASIEKAGGTWLALDVTSPDLEQQVEAVLKVHGHVDVLVHNAGVAVGGAVEEAELSRVRGGL